MYRPRAFAETDLRALDALAEADSFVTLVTVRDAEPTVSHLPVLYRRDGDRVVLVGHWARPNPQAGHTGPGLAILHGPHAYVSPSWYPDKEAAARVPTWNYAVAHLHGALETHEDPAQLGDLVAALSRHHETRVGSRWLFDPERPEHALQLRGIIGFRLEVSRIELKFKLSQNHPPDNRAAVTAQLQASAEPSARAVAALMAARDELSLEGDA
ncbi:MAG: FMN-binding negative transcriptional regulator [Pseudomonadota bacterium]|nr:FMN-binding negative transcriptional regulator [Pseudomonadota bacterium]